MTATLSKTQLCVRAAFFAALTAVCSQLAIPMPWDVPINLATFSVFLAAALLPLPYAVASQTVYVLLGAIGVPVFSGFRGGLSALVGPTGGYLVGYIVAAMLIGLLLCRGRSVPRMVCAMAVGLCGCYVLGTGWLMHLQQVALVPAVTLYVVPYLAGDAIKIGLATMIAKRLEGKL